MSEGTVSVVAFYHGLEQEWMKLGVRVGMRRGVAGLASGYYWSLSHRDVGEYHWTFNVDGLFPWDPNPMRDIHGHPVATIDDMKVALTAQMQDWLEQERRKRA